MIVDLLMDLLQALLTGVLALLPDVDVGDVTGFVTDVVGNLGALNYFLPIAELLTIVIAVLTVFPVLLAISLSLWVFAQIRGSSSVG